VASIDRMSLLELLRKSGFDGDVDFLKEALNVLVHSLMEAEVTAQIGAERYERNTERTNQSGPLSIDWTHGIEKITQHNRTFVRIEWV